MSDPYQNMLNWFGALICKMQKKHVWGRAYDNHFENHPVFHKQCKRCGAVVTVKRRIKKEAA